MTRCKFFKDDQDARNFDLAREGYFMQLGVSLDRTVAIVVDKQTGKMFETYVEFVMLIESPQDVLRDKIIESMTLLVPKNKRDEMEVEVISLFNKYGLR